MPVIASQLGFAIETPLVSPQSPNFRPPRWPPPTNFPIAIDANGNVVCRYGDCRWNLWPWAGKSLTLNFGDGPQREGVPPITAENANLLRQIAAWWLFGPRGVRSVGDLDHRFKLIRPLFIHCSRHGISAAQASRYPAVCDSLPSLLAPSTATGFLAQLHNLFQERDFLGFTLLDRESLRRLEAALPEHSERQTPYIPPHIWSYQNRRLRTFLDEFHEHRQPLEDCFHFCLEAYAKNAGSMALACQRGHIIKSRRPFIGSDSTGARTGAEFHGHFSITAKRFGIDGLLERWVLPSGQSIEDKESTIRLLSSYFSLTSYVAMAYMLNFSMMRVEEASQLRVNCLIVEHDEHFGPIYLLAGPTTKTITDDDARWVTSPSVKVAVDAAGCVATLRATVAGANPATPKVADDLRNPNLLMRSYEPWAGSKALSMPLSVRPSILGYTQITKAFPKLFDDGELTITEADLAIARLVTPTLDSSSYGVGKLWPLAWHQLRRTGAVNMQASGLVSDASVQYQLKHASRAMSLYYGQGYSKVRLNQAAQNDYVRTMYEVLGKEIARLFSDRFVSPHGEQRKASILKLVSAKDSKQLTNAARKGTISWRETLLGGCTKIGPCEYGGIDNVSRCGGGDGSAPCVDALFDREKAPALLQLKHVIENRLIEAHSDSPYQQSLLAQRRAVENALDVIAT